MYPARLFFYELFPVNLDDSRLQTSSKNATLGLPIGRGYSYNKFKSTVLCSI